MPMEYNEKHRLAEDDTGLKSGLTTAKSGLKSAFYLNWLNCFNGRIKLDDSDEHIVYSADGRSQYQHEYQHKYQDGNCTDSEDSDDDLTGLAEELRTSLVIGNERNATGSGTGSASMEHRLKQLRPLMKKHSIGVYIVPSEDEHQSEYTAVADKRREFISGFTGSAGIAIVTLDDGDSLGGEAVLSTDGRYFIQAAKELDPKYWQLLKQGVTGVPTWLEYAISAAKKNKFSNVISTDPRLISVSTGQYFETQAIDSSGEFEFKPLLRTNLVDEVWGSDKPKRSVLSLYELPLKYSGKDANDKLKQVRKEISRRGGSHLVVSSLDETAWLFNLRCDDAIPFNAVFFSYAIVSLDEVTLYVDKRQVDGSAVAKYLETIGGLKVKAYTEFYDDLSSLAPSKKLILPSKAETNFALYSSLSSLLKKDDVVFVSVVSNLKLVKNATEIANAQIAQDKDSYAFIVFTAWLDRQLVRKKTKLTEWDAALKIYAIRKKLDHFKGLSYETIASSGPNSALPHYGPTETEYADIDPTTIFLVDSGAHYLEGTTDITRTYKFGNDGLTDDMIKCYTLVLKGHISVALSQFPEKNPNTGIMLDGYARQPLWQAGLDFNHGTGHGVGSFGDVHEGPVYIPVSPSVYSDVDVYQEGVVLTDEPGYYKEGEYGFRIESDLVIIKGEGESRSGAKFLKFRYLTKVPFCQKLIDKRYLSQTEIEWINEYHELIRDQYAGRLLREGHVTAYTWLISETTPM